MGRESAEWEARLADLWASFDDLSEDDFLAKMHALVAELPAEVASAGSPRV